MVTVQEKIDVLKMARGFIQEPDAWVQGCHAQNDIGEEVAPEEPGAVCFCLEGAIIRALMELSEINAGDPSFPSELLDIEVEVMGDDEDDGRDEDSMTIWNDSMDQTHDEVLARVDATLERLEQKAIAS